MAAVENIEWLNQNMMRAYPIHENADTTPILSSGAKATGLKIPTCLITDLAITLAFDSVSAVTVPTLTGITHAKDGFSFEFSLGETVFAVLSVPSADHTVNKTYAISGTGDNSDCGGWVTIGDIERAATELPEGVYRFDAGQIPFEVSTLRMAPRGIRSITAVGKYGLRTYTPLTGNVKIIAGPDMYVRNDSPTGAIWLEAESSTGYERTEPCDCGTSAKRVVKSINGMRVDDVQFTGDGTCVTITQTQEPPTVKIADTCSTPCCGCTELNFVESAVATINKSISVLNSYAEALRTRLDELQANTSVTQAAIAAYPTK